MFGILYFSNPSTGSFPWYRNALGQEMFMFRALFTDGDSGMEIPSFIWLWEA